MPEGSDTDVTLIIPTIPGREQLLVRAARSVQEQTVAPARTIIRTDLEGVGAAANRNAALEDVTTEFVAFLDDDDELKPHHLAGLLATQKATNADLVYPWYDGINQGLFPFEPLGRPFDDWAANYIRTVGNFVPVTCLVRTEKLRDVGGFVPFDWADIDNPCEDWATWVRMLDAGAVFVHHPEITWTWHSDMAHTSGRPWTRTQAYV